MVDLNYNCQMCGNCCRQYWDVIITKGDLLMWDQAGKGTVLESIQISPLSISPAGLGDPRFGGSFIEVPLLLETKVGDGAKNYNEIEFEKKVNLIKDFVLMHHNYLGEGTSHLPIHDYFSFFFPIETYFEGKGSWPIFSPKSFRVVLDGMELGLKYVLLFDSIGHCKFLKKNLCSIHEFKPQACKMFPLDAEGKLRLNDRVLKLCKGIEPSV